MCYANKEPLWLVLHCCEAEWRGELQPWVPSQGKIPTSTKCSLLRIWSSSHQQYYLFSSEGFLIDPYLGGEQKKFVWSTFSLPLYFFSQIPCFQSWRLKFCLHPWSRTAQQRGGFYLFINVSVYLSIYLLQWIPFLGRASWWAAIRSFSHSPWCALTSI